MSRLHPVFQEALEKLSSGEVDAARKLMGDPYKQAYTEADAATQEAAKKLHEQMHNALQPEAKNHIAPFAQRASAALGVENGLEQAARHLHDAMHVIDRTRAEQATALTAQEAALYKEKGVLGYAKSLMARRWGKGENEANAVQEAPVSPKGLLAAPEHHDHGHCEGHDHHHHHSEDHHHGHAAKTVAKEEASLGAAALEEYAGIRHLNTTGRKLAVGAGASAGLGLIVHGGYNTAKALRGESHDSTALHPSAKEQEGTNWTRLVVGIGEMAAGAALAYRMLTGRWGLRGPVKGVADPIMECGHGHGH